MYSFKMHTLIYLLLVFISTALAAPVAQGIIEDLGSLLSPNTCPSSLSALLNGLVLSNTLNSLLGPLLNNPPSFLATVTTKAQQPVCNPINQGTLICCHEALSGDQDVVVELAQCLNYNLSPNALNGFGCSVSTGTCPGYELPLCCQVLSLVPTLGIGLFCQSIPVTLPHS